MAGHAALLRHGQPARGLRGARRGILPVGATCAAQA